MATYPIPTRKYGYLSCNNYPVTVQIKQKDFNNMSIVVRRNRGFEADTTERQSIPILKPNTS